MDSIVNIILLISFPLLSGFLIGLRFIDEWDIFREDTFIKLQSKIMKLLELLKGKKTTIGAVLALIITYCVAKGYIDNDLALLLSSLLVALGLTANVANWIKK